MRSGIICDDLDECKEKTALCEQKCFNKFGSYSCGCEKGFELNADGITCDGMKTFWRRVICQQSWN